MTAVEHLDPRTPPPGCDLHAYLNWLEDVWAPWIAAGQPTPRTPRPHLTLLRGGRDDG